MYPEELHTCITYSNITYNLSEFNTVVSLEESFTNLGDIWPTADGNHYSHTAALFA